MASEDQIVARVVSGHTSEFRKLVEQHHVPVYRFARNLINNDHDAEDVTQDVFLVAFDRLSTFDGRKASFKTWLYTIARNRCVNLLKRKRPIIDEAIVADTHGSTDDNSARAEFWKRLDEALHELPLTQRTAFVLSEVEGLSYAEICHVEDVTLGTVKSRIHRAKQHLRTVLVPTTGEK